MAGNVCDACLLTDGAGQGAFLSLHLTAEECTRQEVGGKVVTHSPGFVGYCGWRLWKDDFAYVGYKNIE